MEFKDGMDVVVLVESYTHDHLVAVRVEVNERMVVVSAVNDPHFGQMGEQRALDFLYKLHLIYFNDRTVHRIGTRYFMDHERVDVIMVDRALAADSLGRDLKVSEEFKQVQRQLKKLRLVN